MIIYWLLIINYRELIIIVIPYFRKFLLFLQIYPRNKILGKRKQYSKHPHLSLSRGPWKICWLQPEKWERKWEIPHSLPSPPRFRPAFYLVPEKKQAIRGKEREEKLAFLGGKCRFFLKKTNSLFYRGKLLHLPKKYGHNQWLFLVLFFLDYPIFVLPPVWENAVSPLNFCIFFFAKDRR